MAKFDFYPDLHHVHSKVAFFASYEQLQTQIFKNWTFRPHLVPPKGSNRGWYGIYGSSVGYHASNTSPSSKRGKILKISLGIFIVLEITHTCKKSCLWHNLQSIWNGVLLRHTHGENRYSEGMGLIGLNFLFSRSRNGQIAQKYKWTFGIFQKLKFWQFDKFFFAKLSFLSY